MKKITARSAMVASMLAATLGLSACSGDDPVPPVTSEGERKVVTVAQATETDDVVGATDHLGLLLLASAPADDNAVVSPASAVIALSMLAEGARGVTAQQFDAALGASGQDRTDAVNALLAALEQYAGDPAVVQEDELPETPVAHVANQIVLDDEFTARPEFLNALGSGYGAGVLVTDLGNKEGKKVLDAWVKENTGGLIKESAIEPNPNLRLVLQNATVFAGAWAEPFEEYATGPREFTLASGERVDTDMMAQVGQFKYAEAEGWQAVRLPYTAGFQMDVLLPPQGNDPATITPELNADLTGKLDSAKLVKVDLSMPTVDIENETLDLEPALESAGLGDLFAAPDLSGIADADLYLDQAKQQAVLTIDEAGTIAAAVTELAVGESSAPMDEDQKTFRADRPYLLSIAHTETGWSLFMATIRDPRH